MATWSLSFFERGLEAFPFYTLTGTGSTEITNFIDACPYGLRWNSNGTGLVFTTFNDVNGGGQAIERGDGDLVWGDVVFRPRSYRIGLPQ